MSDDNSTNNQEMKYDKISFSSQSIYDLSQYDNDNISIDSFSDNPFDSNDDINEFNHIVNNCINEKMIYSLPHLMKKMMIILSMRKMI